MIKRRDLLLGGLAVGALALSEGLRPRRKLKLLQGAKVEDTIPSQFAGWQAQTSDLVSPEQAGRLAKSLYSEIVGRTYFNESAPTAVMLLAAYGDTQSDLLQLHRPESCYPAVGFTLSSMREDTLPLGGGASLPIKRVVAVMGERVENIVYWTRMGEAIPRSAGEQREARLINAMHGFVADGILVRCSALGDTGAAFALLDRFIPSMLHAVPRPRLPALIGTSRSQRMA